MKCPNCGFEQPEGLADCQKCQIIFAKWIDRQTKQSSYIGSDPIPNISSPAPAASASPASSNFSALLQGLALAAVVGLTLWVFFGGGGLPVPDGAIVRDADGFACSPIPGWVLVTRQNLSDVDKQYGELIPAAMKSSVSSGSVELAFVKLGVAGAFTPSVNVVVHKGYMPEIDEKEKKKAADVIAREFSMRFMGYIQDSAEIVSIDKLDSLKIASRAETQLATALQTYQKAELKFVQMMVPGRGRAYIITCTSDASEFMQNAADFNNFLNSFRVTERPSMLGNPILAGGVKGGLVSMGMSLLVSLFRALLR